MKRILAALAAVLLAAQPAAAIDIITASISVTNEFGTTNGQTLTVNASVRTWTNNVFVPASQILTNETPAGAATNLFYHVSTYPFTALSLGRTTSTNITLQTSPGGALTVTLSPGWGTVSYSTQSLVSATAVRVPISTEVSAQRINIGSGLVAGIEDYSTNSFNQNSTAMSEVVGLTNAQTVGGIKLMTNAASQWRGLVSNSPAISGNIIAVSNGIWWNGILYAPVLTNGVNYGNAFRSPGSGFGSEQFGTSASASGESSVAIGNLASSSGELALAVGQGANASGANSVAVGNNNAASGANTVALGAQNTASASGATALGAISSATHVNSTALGRGATTTADNQIRIGTAAEHVSIAGTLRSFTSGSTNNFPAGADISFGRYAVTSLANGNNAAVPVGTNVFVEVSGPSGAFTINGINGSPNRDGKLLIVVNQTGQDMTIAHQSGVDATAGNRIITMTGADRATTGNGAATLIYSGAASRWILVSFDP
jgi:hypothetical protein